MSEKQPWLKFFPSDWRGSARLKSCSAVARSVLIEMMCIMHDAERYGYLEIAARGVTDAELAAQSGLPVRQVTTGRLELESKGVIERDADGRLFNPRMVRDESIRQKRATGGKLGGNPSLTKEDNQKVNLPDNHKGYGEGYTHGRAHAEPDARCQIETPSTNALGGRAKNGATPKSAPKRGARLSEDWQPAQQHRELAARLGVDVESEAERFRDHAKAKGRIAQDWDAAFRNWLRKAPELAGPSRAKPSADEKLLRHRQQIEAVDLNASTTVFDP